MDEESTPLTIWGCRNCSYQAYEDESFERMCLVCDKKFESRLEDEDKKYWWCCQCDQITVIAEEID